MIQGAYDVRCIDDPEDPSNKTLSVRKIPANCEFVCTIWANEQLAYIPGNPTQNAAVVVRAVGDLKQHEQLFVDYGDQAAKEFFGVETILGLNDSHPNEHVCAAVSPKRFKHRNSQERILSQESDVFTFEVGSSNINMERRRSSRLSGR